MDAANVLSAGEVRNAMRAKAVFEKTCGRFGFAGSKRIVAKDRQRGDYGGITYLDTYFLKRAGADDESQ